MYYHDNLRPAEKLLNVSSWIPLPFLHMRSSSHSLSNAPPSISAPHITLREPGGAFSILSSYMVHSLHSSSIHNRWFLSRINAVHSWIFAPYLGFGWSVKTAGDISVPSIELCDLPTQFSSYSVTLADHTPARLKVVPAISSSNTIPSDLCVE